MQKKNLDLAAEILAQDVPALLRKVPTEEDQAKLREADSQVTSDRDISHVFVTRPRIRHFDI